jgi:iron complex transport system ATP-binding protein
MDMKPAYTLESVDFSYRPGKPVLEDVQISLSEGEFYAIIGPNGAGKSTLLGLLSGRLYPTKGTVCLRGKPVASWPRREFARLVGVVPQREESVFDFTVREMVLMGRFPFQKGPLGIESSHDYEIVEKSLERADILHLADRPILSLSGGERQRTLVARALAQEPDVLLLDEPNSALDPLHQKMLLSLIAELNRRQGKTVVFVSHDLALVGSFSQRVIVMDNGRILREGPAHEIIEAGFLSGLYRTPIEVERREDHSVLVGLRR